MRRGVAAIILGISLVVASVAWSGFVLTRTALDPSRSERLADQLFENEVLRAALVSRLADSMQTAVPADVAIPRELLEAAASTALDNPDVQQLVRGGIVDVHRSALEGNAEPVTIDAAALGSATRAALVGVRPELDLVLPVAPVIEVELPVGGLSVLGTLRSFVLRVTRLLALAATAGAVLALVIAKNRPAILRRVAFWAFGAALFWVIVGFGIPFLAERLAPTSLAIVAAIVDVFFGAMIRPGLLLALFGAVLLGVSVLWSAADGTRGARALQPATERPAGPRPSTADPRRRIGSQASNVRSPAAAPPQMPAAPAGPRVTPTGLPPTGAARSNPPPVDRTIAMPISPDPSPAPRVDPDTPFGPAPRWEPGVGYLDDVPLPPREPPPS